MLGSNDVPSSSKIAEAAPSYWEEISAVLHEKVKTRAPLSNNSVSRLNRYYDDLGIAARQGDVNAIKETNALRAYLDSTHKLAEPPYSEWREKVKRAIQEYDELRAFAEPLNALAYMATVRQLENDLESEQGHSSDTDFSKPYFVEDTSAGEKLLQRTRRKLAKERGGTDPDVGYRKPPVERRYRKGQSGNPNGRRKGSRDQWTPLRDSLVKKIPALVDGRKTKLTSAAIITRRLVDLATKGCPRARRELRKLIIELDKRGLLHKPPTRPRRRRSRSKPGSGPGMDVIIAVFSLSQLTVKEAMDADYAKVYGPDLEFRENIEREREKALDVLKAYCAAQRSAVDAQP